MSLILLMERSDVPVCTYAELSKLQSLPWTTDAVGDDAYHWEIAFSSFDSPSPLAQVGDRHHLAC